MKTEKLQKVKEELLKEQKGCCFYCDQPFDDEFPAVVSKIIDKPAYCGGMDKGNLVLACACCDALKNDVVMGGGHREYARDAVRKLIKERYGWLCGLPKS